MSRLPAPPFDPAHSVRYLAEAHWPLERLRPYRFHYIGVPAPVPEDLAHLKWAIRKDGVLVPLDILPDGQVVDGQHRLRIAQALRLPMVPVRVCEFSDKFAIEWHAIRSAVKRRHLTTEQKLRLIDALLPAEQEASRQRRLETLKQSRHQAEQRAAPGGPGGTAIAQVAHTLEMKPRKLEQYYTVAQHAPDLAQQVLDAKLSVSAAYHQTRQAMALAKAPSQRPRLRRPRPAPALRPPPARIPDTVPITVRETYARIMQWIERSPRWPARTRTEFWDTIKDLAQKMDELVDKVLVPISKTTPIIEESSSGDLA